MLSNSEMKHYLKLKKRISNEKYQLWLIFILLFLSAVLSIKYKELSTAFLLPSLVLVAAMLYRGDTKELIKIVDNTISSDHENLTKLSKINNSITKT